MENMIRHCVHQGLGWAWLGPLALIYLLSIDKNTITKGSIKIQKLAIIGTLYQDMGCPNHYFNIKHLKFRRSEGGSDKFGQWPKFSRFLILEALLNYCLRNIITRII